MRDLLFCACRRPRREGTNKARRATESELLAQIDSIADVEQ